MWTYLPELLMRSVIVAATLLVQERDAQSVCVQKGLTEGHFTW